MVCAPFSRRAVDSGVHPVRALLNTLLPAFFVGFVQAVLLWFVQVVAIGVHPAHPVAMFGVLWFVCWVFISVILALNLLLGPAPGRLATMALMSLQLVASNGLYPPEVQPPFVQWAHSWDPLRFSVDLMRYALFGMGEADPRLFTAVAVLLLLAVFSWASSVASLYRHRVIRTKVIGPSEVAKVAQCPQKCMMVTRHQLSASQETTMLNPLKLFHTDADKAESKSGLSLASASLRLPIGLFFLNSGATKTKADRGTAEWLQNMASTSMPFVKQMDAENFTKLLSAAELGLGTAMLLPFVPNRLVGAGLTAFSTGLLSMYFATPGMTQNDGIRPTNDGTPLAKDFWLAGAGVALMALSKK